LARRGSPGGKARLWPNRGQEERAAAPWGRGKWMYVDEGHGAKRGERIPCAETWDGGRWGGGGHWGRYVGPAEGK